MTDLIPLTNTPRDYAWGAIDGVSLAMGWETTGRPQAELWLGAHPLSPARSAGDAPWRDLEEWQARASSRLPYLLKVLSAAAPLSLQAHPTTGQARAGFAREQAAGIPLDAAERNYKDPFAKPEMIVALDDGFDALCGFRPVRETIAVVDALSEAVDEPALATWRALLAGDGRDAGDVRGAGDVRDAGDAARVREAFAWLLGDDPAVARLVAAVVATARAQPGRFELVERLAASYPADPGVVIALMLNRVVLARGEALWLPAGNVHAYLRGTGIELMGPSDNVLRGGLTPKHVDRAELQAVLDFTPGAPPRLLPVPVSPQVVSYRPPAPLDGTGFELLLVAGDASFDTAGPAIALVADGAFTLSADGGSRALGRGDIVFAPDAARLEASGAGRLFVAAPLPG